MKKLYALVASILLVSASYAQDCSGSRYYEQIFSNTISTLDIKYGENYKQDGTTTQELFMDIYTPEGDTDTDRPVILMAHGGSFIGGTRTDIAENCKAFAKLGYVAISMSYRLLEINASVLMSPGLEFQKEVVRSMHDMRAAIRYLRKTHAEDGNPYGINPDIIIVGGYSAGAILANHVAYMDLETEIPSILTTYVTEQGGLEGTSGNPGYRSDAQMVLSLCGAIRDTSYMTSGSVPFLGVHNETDNIVPNIFGQPNVMITIPVDLYGDSLMYKRALNQGIPADYMMVPTTGHCEFPVTETFNFVKAFTHEQLCIQGLSIKHSDMILYSVYPNPANETIVIDIPSNQWSSEIEIYDMMGKLVYNSTISSGQNVTQIDISTLPQGIYNVQLNSTGGRAMTKRFVKM